MKEFTLNGRKFRASYSGDDGKISSRNGNGEWVLIGRFNIRPIKPQLPTNLNLSETQKMALMGAMKQKTVQINLIKDLDGKIPERGLMNLGNAIFRLFGKKVGNPLVRFVYRIN